MHPRLFEWHLPSLPIVGDIGPLTVYTYGLLLATAYLLGLQLAMRRAKARGLDQARVLDLGIYIIISALVGAKLLLLITDFRSFASNPRALLDLARSGGVFYGRLDPRGRGRAVVHPPRSACRSGPRATCSPRALRSVTSSDGSGCFFAGCCYGKPTTVPWAITFTDPYAALNVGTPLNIPLHPTQLYEAGAEALILVLLLATESTRPAFSGADVLALHAALRDLALHHRDLQGRSARHGADVLDLAVHFDHPRAAGARHAVLFEPQRSAGAKAARQAA